VDRNLAEFRPGVVSEAAVVRSEIAKTEAIEVVFVRRIAEGAEIGVVRRLNPDRAAGPNQTVELLHGRDDVVQVLDDVDGGKAVEAGIGEGVRTVVEIDERVGTAVGIAVDADCSRLLVETAADVKDSQRRRRAGGEHSSSVAGEA